MKKMIVSFIIIFISGIVLIGQQPDLIIKKGGTKIYCKILSIDEKYIEYEYSIKTEEGIAIRRVKLDIIFVKSYQYDYVNDPNYEPPPAETNVLNQPINLNLPKNYKIKEKTDGRTSLTDEQLRFAIERREGTSYVGVVFTIGGVITFVTGLAKLSEYEEPSWIWEVGDDGTILKGVVVAMLGIVVTATGGIIWGVNSHKANSYKKVLLSRGIEASITPFTNFNLQTNTPYSGLTLTVRF